MHLYKTCVLEKLVGVEGDDVEPAIEPRRGHWSRRSSIVSNAVRGGGSGSWLFRSLLMLVVVVVCIRSCS